MPNQRSLGREILWLAWPAVLTSLLETAVFLADRVMLGRYSEDALASMQVQGPVLWSLEMVFMGTIVGTVALVSRSVGARDFRRAEAAARAALRSSLIAGVVAGGACVLFVDAIVGALGPESATLRALSRDYLVVAALGLPLAFVGQGAAMVFWGSGNTRTPFVVGIATNIVNVVANLGLIYGVEWGPVRLPELGVVGAALGSVGAYALQALLLLHLLSRKTSVVTVRGTWSWVVARSESDVRAIRDVVRISMPALLERLVNNGAYLVYAGIITSLGALVMAANQSLLTLEAVCFMGADGFGVAAGTIVGQALGRGAVSDAKKGGLMSAGFAAAVLSVLGVLIWVTGEWTLRGFVPEGSDGAALVQESLRAMPLLAAAQPFMATAVVLAQGLRGAGDTKSPLYAAVVGGLFVRVGLAWALATHTELGVSSVWVASGADWVVRCVFLGTVFFGGRWTRVRV